MCVVIYCGHSVDGWVGLTLAWNVQAGSFRLNGKLTAEEVGYQRDSLRQTVTSESLANLSGHAGEPEEQEAAWTQVRTLSLLCSMSQEVGLVRDWGERANVLTGSGRHVAVRKNVLGARALSPSALSARDG